MHRPNDPATTGPLLGLLCVPLLLVLGGSPATATETRPRWEVDDIVLAETSTDWSVAPDGRSAVWVRGTVETVDGEEKRVSNLWITDLDSGGSRALTRGRDRVSRPAFAPDGRHLAFLWDREISAASSDELGSTQLWVLPMAGGEPYAATRFDRSVEAFEWRGGERLVVVAPEARAAWERERRQRRDRAQVVEEPALEPPVRLFEVGLDGQEVRRVTDDTDWIDRLAVAPDGRRAVVRAQRSLSYTYDQRVLPRTFLVDLSSGERTPILTDTDLVPEELEWAPDGSLLYFTNLFSRHPRYRIATITELHALDPASGRVEKLDLDWEWGLGSTFAPLPDGFLALLADGVRYRPARYERTRRGWRKHELSGEHVRHIEDWAVSPDGGRVVYQRSSATEPIQWYGARLERSRLAGERRLTELNRRYEGKPTGRVEKLSFPGADGAEIEALLYYPLDWREGERRPLLLHIHGGPGSVDRDAWRIRWSAPLLLWRQRGAFVLQVNYHGSSNYGLDFVESIAGSGYYDLPIADLEAGVDHVVGLGLADPDRLGSTGWSNGGILTAELITRTDRYRVASVGAATIEWISDWANVDFGAAFDQYYFGASPLEDPQLYVEKSPFFRLDRVATPTILFTGTEDRAVPPGSSWSLFRALQQKTDTPHRFVLFPGEAHGLSRPAHQRRKIEEQLAWLDAHLFGEESPEPAVVRPGTPLEALVQRAGAARVGAAFGLEHEGHLVPETVPLAGLEVGRFEVTRAQFATFDPDSEVTPGEENLPATGVSFERARAYAAWLAERTGRPFRLPTVAEAERLVAAAAGEGGNTLERWAGYAPNPEDLARIRQELAAAGGEEALLLPVGSLPGTGDPAVFDLDGNAAEWAVGEDGEGVAVGPSAERASDPRHRDGRPPAAATTGLRVVVGGAGGG